MWYKYLFKECIWRDFRLPMSALATAVRKSFDGKFTVKIDLISVLHSTGSFEILLAFITNECEEIGLLNFYHIFLFHQFNKLHHSIAMETPDWESKSRFIKCMGGITGICHFMHDFVMS